MNQPITSTTGNPFGLSAFGLLIALATLVVVGGALGGGLGGALASEHSKKSNYIPIIRTVTITTTASPTASPATAASATPTSGTFTNLTVPSPSHVDSLFFNCPAMNSTSYASTNNEAFTFTCGVAYPGGEPAYSGGTIATLAGLIAYTPQDCAVACSTFNWYSALYGNSTVCNAITIKSDLSGALATYGANCWLFNATGPPGFLADAVSGVLQ